MGKAPSCDSGYGIFAVKVMMARTLIIMAVVDAKMMAFLVDLGLVEKGFIRKTSAISE